MLSFSLFTLLCNQAAAFDLKCNFNVVNWRLTSGVACIVEEVVITSSYDIISSVNGRNEAELEMRIFIVKNQKVNKFPQDLNKFFKKLEGIEIFNSSLKSLGQADLKPLENLKELWLGYNELETLEAGLFDFNTKLEIIVLNKNRLRFIAAYILTPLTKLSKANFNNNTCIDKYAGTRLQRQELEKELVKKCLRQTQPLKKDEIQKAINQIEVLTTKLSSAEAKLKLSEGNLVAATKHLLESSKKTFRKFIPGEFNNPVVDLICRAGDAETCEAAELKILLPHTEISSIQRENNETTVVARINTLIIAKQQILYLPSNIANYFSNLTHLAVTFTGIFSIEPHIYENLTKLVHLSLSNSVIHEVPSNAFLYLRILHELDLSFNKITKIEERAFNGLANLEELRLNDNLLEEINGNTFESLRQLLRLSMNNNRLRTIGLGLFSPLTKLKAADFSGNECIDTSFPKEHLQEIATKMRDLC